MLTKQYTEAVLNKFADDVIRQARANKLSAVSQSLDKNIQVSDNSFMLEFTVPEGFGYADFLDQGVRGSESSSKAPRSPYRFGTGSYKGLTGKGGDFERNIAQWIKKKRLRLKDKETGRFQKGTQTALNFLIRRSIYKTGLRPTYYFTNAFNQYYALLPEDLIEVYALDAEQLIETTFRDHLKQ